MLKVEEEKSLKTTWDYSDLSSNFESDVEKENLCLMVGVENEVHVLF